MPLCAFEGDAGFADGRVKIAAPIPCGDGNMCLGAFYIDAHLFGATPCGGANVGVFEVVGF